MLGLKRAWNTSKAATVGLVLSAAVAGTSFATQEIAVTKKAVDANISQNHDVYAAFCAAHPKGNLGVTPTIANAHIWPLGQEIAPWTTSEQCMRARAVGNLAFPAFLGEELAVAMGGISAMGFFTLAGRKRFQDLGQDPSSAAQSDPVTPIVN